MVIMTMMMIIVSPLHALFFCRAEAEEVSHSETSSPDPVKREQKRRHRGSYCMMVPFTLFWFYTHTTLQDDTHSVCFFFVIEVIINIVWFRNTRLCYFKIKFRVCFTLSLGRYIKLMNLFGSFFEKMLIGLYALSCTQLFFVVESTLIHLCLEYSKNG